MKPNKKSFINNLYLGNLWYDVLKTNTLFSMIGNSENRKQFLCSHSNTSWNFNSTLSAKRIHIHCCHRKILECDFLCSVWLLTKVDLALPVCFHYWKHCFPDNLFSFPSLILQQSSERWIWFRLKKKKSIITPTQVHWKSKLKLLAGSWTFLVSYVWNDESNNLFHNKTK